MAAYYDIADEPKPSTLARFVVSPLWPLLALMLAGEWVGWVWFLFNGIAVGSSTLRREIVLIVAALALSAAASYGVLAYAVLETASKGAIPYLGIVTTVVPLIFAYAIHILQSRSVDLFEYFGGELRSGLPILILATILSTSLIMQVDSPFLKLFLW